MLSNPTCGQIITSCCPGNYLPLSMTMSISSTCPIIDGQSIPLSYSYINNTHDWSGTVEVDCAGVPMQLTGHVGCWETAWVSDILGVSSECAISGGGNGVSVDCSGFTAIFNGFLVVTGSVCCCTPFDTFVITSTG